MGTRPHVATSCGLSLLPPSDVIPGCQADSMTDKQAAGNSGPYLLWAVLSGASAKHPDGARVFVGVPASASPDPTRPAEAGTPTNARRGSSRRPARAYGGG